MGDPETEVVMPRIKSDIVPLLVATARGELNRGLIEFETHCATTVMLVAAGYPGTYEKGKKIGVEKLSNKNIISFHAGTILTPNELITNGGRVMAITGLGDDLTQALANSYAGVRSVSCEGMNYRLDIGFDLKSLDGK